jgi:glycosyltransferase involved in cell wall biosynthesis
MKILQVTPRYPPQSGGVERHVKKISERLVERGHEVTVLSSDARNEGERRERRNGVVVRRYRGVAPNGVMQFCPQIVSAVRRSDSDVVHAHNYHSFPLFFSAVGVGDQRFVVTTHYHGESPSSIRDRLLSLYRPFGRWALETADEIIAVSEWERNRLKYDFNINSIVVPNGIKHERFEKIEEFEANRPYLLTVGRLEEYKCVQHVIRSLPKLPDYDLYVVGKGPYYRSLKQIASQVNVLDRVKFKGYVSDDKLSSLYLGAEVNLNLSEQESYGLTVAEALAAGTSCVVRDSGALTEWLQYDGVYGSSQSPEQVAKACETAADTCPSVSLPSWDKVSVQIAGIYQS